MVKKLNTVVSLVCGLSLLGHFLTMTYSMMTGWYDFNLCKKLAHTTAISVSVHVILVLIILFFLHDGSSYGAYKSRNIGTIVQRASGLLMIIFVHFHVTNYGFIMSHAAFQMDERIRICLMETIFFVSVFAHLASSFSKAFITLGILTDIKKVKILDKIIGIFSLVCMQKMCGACGMVICGKPALACDTFLNEIKGDILVLEPLFKFTVRSDLKVDRSIIQEHLLDAGMYDERRELEDKKVHEHCYQVSKCLKCGLCLEVCPNYVGGPNFYGASLANDAYILYAEKGDRSKEIKRNYKEHFSKGCSKSLACVDVCPMGINTVASMAKMNR